MRLRVDEVPSATLWQYRILHVIAPSFAGKSTYIQQHFPDYPSFDIGQFYQRIGGDRKEIFFNFPVEQRVRILEQGLLQELEVEYQIILETSGVNPAINYWLQASGIATLTVLLNPPQDEIEARIHHRAHQEGYNPDDPGSLEQFYAEVLGFNPMEFYVFWQQKYESGEVTYDTIYDHGTDQYHPPCDPAAFLQG